MKAHRPVRVRRGPPRRAPPARTTPASRCRPRAPSWRSHSARRTSSRAPLRGNTARPTGSIAEVEQAVVPAAERDVAAPRRVPHGGGDGIAGVHDPRLRALLGHEVQVAVRVASELVGRADGRGSTAYSSSGRQTSSPRRTTMPQRTSRPSSTYVSTSAASACAKAESQRRGVVALLEHEGHPVRVVRVDRLDHAGVATVGGSPRRRTSPAGTSTPAAATTASALALSAVSAITAGALPTYGMPSTSNSAR